MKRALIVFMIVILLSALIPLAAFLSDKKEKADNKQVRSPYLSALPAAVYFVTDNTAAHPLPDTRLP